MSDGSISEITLERFKFGVINYVSAELLKQFAGPSQGDFACEAAATEVGAAVVFRFKQYIFGRQAEMLTISYPADWWQALRQRWLPAWWLCRWPVRMVTHTVDVKALYPGFALPPHQHIMHLEHREFPSVRPPRQDES